jgi:putative FmdB family regulatory protein
MPIYEYECGKCGVFEVSQRISEAALSKCPTCRRRVRRLISNTSFQLKGSGWYVTDYARGGKKGSGEGASDGGGKGDAKSETKTESKAESKAEPKTKKSDPKGGSGTSATAA